jgi:hypothetical protein
METEAGRCKLSSLTAAKLRSPGFCFVDPGDGLDHRHRDAVI